jgi:hypothetical protein
MVFQKGREKSGGRKKGASNKATESIKNALNALLTEDELEECWRRFLNHKDSSIAWKAFELYHEYRFGKPVQMVVGEELAPPIRIDISAIPTRHVKA